MGVTKTDKLHTAQCRILYSAVVPTLPYLYYGSASNDVDSCEWKGGEMFFHSGETRLYIQTATSGTTPTWKRLLDKFT